MWIFDDGTIVQIGGIVLGETVFAGILRADLRRRPTVAVRAAPGGRVRLSANSSRHIDLWCRDMARLHDRRVIRAPQLTAAVRLPSDAPPDAIF